MKRARSNRSIHGVVLGLTLLPLLAGCQSLPHPKAKKQAEARWSAVRSKVKLQLAQEQFGRRQFSDALAVATESIALDPTDAAAYALGAKCHLELGQAASAERLLDAAKLANVSSPELHYLRGVVLELRGDLTAAIDAYRTAREGDHKRVDFLLAEAECLGATGQGSAALDLLEKSSHDYDERGDIAVLAARIAEYMHDSPTAIRWYREARATLPDDSLVAEGLGVLLAQRGECVEAIHLLEPLIRPSDKNGRGAVRRALASCYLRADNAAAAQAVLTDYADEAPTDYTAQLFLAQASLALGDLITAAEAVHRLETYAPSNRDIALTRALLDWRRGRVADAANQFERLVEQNPSDAEASCLLGEALVSLGETGEAADAFNRALAVDPGSAWAKRRLADLPR